MVSEEERVAGGRGNNGHVGAGAEMNGAVRRVLDRAAPVGEAVARAIGSAEEERAGVETGGELALHDLEVALPLLGEGGGGVGFFAAAEVDEGEGGGVAGGVEEGGGVGTKDCGDRHGGRVVPVPEWEGEGGVVEELAEDSLVEVEVGAVPWEEMP